MQKQNQIFVTTIFLVVLLSLFHSGEAIKCYQCPTEAGQICPDTPVKDEETTCEDAYKACVRFTMDIQGKTYIGRTCATPGACKAAGEIYNFKSCSECSTDLCNGSAANAVSIVMMLTSGVITLLWTTQ